MTLVLRLDPRRSEEGGRPSEARRSDPTMIATRATPQGPGRRAPSFTDLVGGPLPTAPVLSIVIPVYNREGSIARTVVSILRSAAAAQVGPGQVEMIIVDDGSRDNSAEAAATAAREIEADVDVTVLRQANGGAGAARNFGVAHARGAFIAFVDSDDVWFDWTLPACLHAIRDQPDAALFFLKPCVFSETRPLRPQQTGFSRLDRHEGFVSASLRYSERSFGTNNVIVRRDVFGRLDGFAAEFRCLEDTDLFLRADAEGACIVFDGDDLVGRQRGEDDSLTDNWFHVVDGLEKMKAKERDGLYPHGAHGDTRRLQFVAGTAVRAARLCFANGEPLRAYRIFFANLGPILRGRRHWVLRLPFTPLLSLVRPKSFPFRLRAAKAPNPTRAGCVRA
jgi:GT2 family glycosyltransferase